MFSTSFLRRKWDSNPRDGVVTALADFKSAPFKHLGIPPLLSIQSYQRTFLQIYNFLFKKQIFYHHFSYLFVVGNISQVGIEQGISLPYLLDCDQKGGGDEPSFRFFQLGQQGLNLRPTGYESVALPLSYIPILREANVQNTSLKDWP